MLKLHLCRDWLYLLTGHQNVILRIHLKRHPSLNLKIMANDTWKNLIQYSAFSSKRNHICMTPSSNIARAIDSKPHAPQTLQIAVYLPYLHWCERGEQKAEADKDEQLRILGLQKRDHHPRRTLDRYHYRYGTDTTSRDADQILYHKGGFKKMLMVDQMWIFVTCEATYPIKDTDT